MTQDNPSISLEGAFRHVLWLYEEDENVPEEMRLGVQLNTVMPFDWPQIVATGLKFNEPIVAVTHPNQGPPPPRRPGEPPRAIPLGPPVYYVPDVPSSFQLDRLLLDESQAPQTQSDHERRICWTHRWLLAALTDEVAPIDSWGQCKVRFSSDKYNFPGELRKWPYDEAQFEYRGFIDQDCWRHGSVSYRESKVLGGDLDWHIPIDNALYEGRLNIEDIRLDQMQFLDRIDSTLTGETSAPEAAPSKEVVTLCAQRVHGLMRWSIERQGERVDLASDPDAGLERGLLALLVLIQNAGKRVSNFLIKGLVRRDSHGRQTDPAKIKEAKALAKAIDPLAQDMLYSREDIGILHEKLKHAVINLQKTKEIKKEFTNYFGHAALSHDIMLPRGKLIDYEVPSINESSRKSIKNTLVLIEDKTKILKMTLDEDASKRNQLEKNFLQKDPYSFKYDPGLSTYDWKVRASFDDTESAVESD